MPRHHAPRADDSVVADRDARQQDRAAADPDVAADADRLAALVARSAQGRIARVVGGQHLHAGADLAGVAHLDADHVRKTQPKLTNTPAPRRMLLP